MMRTGGTGMRRPYRERDEPLVDSGEIIRDAGLERSCQLSLTDDAEYESTYLDSTNDPADEL